MDLSCPNCSFTTALPDGQEPPEGARATCPSCGRVSVYLRGGLVDDQPTPPHGTEPLPSLPPLILGRRTPPASGWRLRTAAGEEGPLALDAIKAMIRTGSLHPDDAALAPDEAEWRRAGDIPALARYFKLKDTTPRGAGAAAPSGAAPCFMHASRPGAFHCPSCGSMLCPECAVARQIGMMKVNTCPRCEQAVVPWVPSKVIIPFWTEIPKLLLFPVRGLGILGPILCTVLGVGAMMGAAVGGIAGLFTFLFLMACVTAYHLVIIKNAVTGGRRVPDLSGIEDAWREMVWPGARAALVTAIVFAGPVTWQLRSVAPARAETALRQATLDMAREDREAFERGDFDEERQPAEEGAAWGDDSTDSADEPARAEAAHELAAVMGDAPGGGLDLPELNYREEPRDLDYYQEHERNARRDLETAESSVATSTIVFWLLLLAAYGMWPILLIVVALFNTVMPALQPAILLRIIGEIPREYAWCVAFSTVCFVASELVALAFEGVLLLQHAASNPVSYYFTFIAFHVMGRTAEMAEQKIDWH